MGWGGNKRVFVKNAVLKYFSLPYYNVKTYGMLNI